MKDRLTRTIDPLVLRRAKHWARRQNASLSSVIENPLRQLSDPEARPEPASFSERWKGKLNLHRRNEPRFERLAKKHALE